VVAVAQLVESRIVIPVVVGSSPISHPKNLVVKTKGYMLLACSPFVVLEDEFQILEDQFTISSANMPQFRENCIFCRREAPLSKQHVWPDWLRGIFPSQPVDAIHSQMRTHLVDGALEFSPSGKIRNGDMLTTKYRKVCRECNNGWISVVEEAAKPIAQKLILGKEFTIENDELLTFSIWISIVTVMAEYSHPPTIAISADDVHYIYLYRRPLPLCRIYIGQYLGSEYAPYRYRHVATAVVDGDTYKDGDPVPSRANTQVSIHVVGEMLAVVDSVSEEKFESLMSERRSRKDLVPIWPGPEQAIAWPPRNAFGDAAVDSLFNDRRSLNMSKNSQDSAL
jgi:hypothetical protein